MASGKVHHRRLHNNGQARENALNGVSQWLNYPQALEDVPSYHQNWIPTGVFFDLTDPANSSITENLDVVQGVSISQMYNTFSPNTKSFCEYKDRFVNLFPNATENQFNNILIQNQHGGCHQ